MDVYKTSNSTCTLYLSRDISIAVAFMLAVHEQNTPTELTNIQCPVLNCEALARVGKDRQGMATKVKGLKA